MKDRPTPDSATERASLDTLHDFYREALSPPERPAIAIPDLDSYGLEVQDLLGMGGMGAVYRAHQRHPDRNVAVKVLSHAGGPHNAESRERFEREIRALSSLNSPYVVPIYGAGTTPEGLPFYVMELVEGVPLEEYAAEHDLTLHDRLELFANVCEGVQAAHRIAIIHRDLKPSNILVDRQGRPRVLDLGLAKFLRQNTREWGTISRVAQIMGTPGFMAPEQFQADTETVDTRADCYSLGVMLYRLVVETHPYPVPDSTLATMKVVCTADPAKPRDRAPELPRDIEAVLLKALDKDPDRRYQSPEALGADIKRFLGKRPVEARLPTVSYRIGKFIARNRVPVAVAATATLIVLLMLSVSAANIIAARRQADAALQSERDAKQELSRRAYLNSLAAIDGRIEDQDYGRAGSLLAQAPAAERSWEWRHLAYRASPWLATFAVDREVTCMAQLSESVCVTGDKEGEISVWDTITGVPVRSWPAHDGAVIGVSVSADGRHVLSSGRREATLWDVDRGEAMHRFGVDPGAGAGVAAAPRFGPRGTIVLPRRGRIQLVDYEGRVRTSLPTRGRLTACTVSHKANMIGWAETTDEQMIDGFVNVHTIHPDFTAADDFIIRYRSHALAISDDGLRVAVAGTNVVRLKELDTGNFHSIRQGHTRGALTFLPDSHHLLVSSARGLEILRERDGGRIDAATLMRAEPQGASAGNGGRELLVLKEGTLRILATSHVEPRITRGPSADRGWTLSQDGSALAVMDQALSLIDTRTGRLLCDAGRQVPAPSETVWHPSHDRIALGRKGSPHITTVELKTGVSRVLPPVPGGVLGLAWGSNDVTAAVTIDGMLYLRYADAGTWRPAAVDIRARTEPPLLRFDKPGERLAVGMDNLDLAVIDVQSGMIRAYFSPGSCENVLFSPDGEWLLTAGFDTATLWHAATQTVQGALQPFTPVEGRRALAFSPDSRRVIVGERRAVSIWDVQSCRKLMEEPIPLLWAMAAGFDAAGNLTLAGPDGALTRLDVSTDTHVLPTDQRDQRHQAWREIVESSRVESSRPGTTVGFAGLEPDSIPGTPGSHAEEIGFWREQEARALCLPGRTWLEPATLAQVSVLRLHGLENLTLSEADRTRG